MELCMARTRKNTLRPFQKIMKIMMDGKPLMKADLPKIFGEDFLMYKVSSYILDIKIFSGATVKVIKDGRKVVSYQMINPEKAKAYLEKIGKIDIDVPEIKSLSELNAQPEVISTEDVSKSKVEVLEVTEITE